MLPLFGPNSHLHLLNWCNKNSSHETVKTHKLILKQKQKPKACKKGLSYLQAVTPTLKWRWIGGNTCRDVFRRYDFGAWQDIQSRQQGDFIVHDGNLFHGAHLKHSYSYWLLFLQNTPPFLCPTKTNCAKIKLEIVAFIERIFRMERKSAENQNTSPFHLLGKWGIQICPNHGVVSRIISKTIWPQ